MKNIAFALLYASMSVASASDVNDLLEPCINGGVSASGNYVSQEQEEAQQLALEPCINGAVSASGIYASQEQEDTLRFAVKPSIANQLTIFTSHKNHGDNN